MTLVHVRTLLGPLLAAALLVSACGGDAVTARGDEAAAAVVIGEDDFVRVRKGEVRRGPTLSGRLTPEQQANVRAEVGGPIVSVHAEPGENVRRGALLATLDDAALREQIRSARIAVTSARTALDLAERNFERSQRLYEGGAIAELDLENARRAVTTARSQFADARARLTSAQEDIARTRVMSPMSGVVSERPVNAGDVVQPGAHLFTIVNPGSMRFEGSIPAVALANVGVGDPVTFRVSGYPERTFQGRVTRINPTADPVTGQVRLFVGIPNDGHELVGGLFAEGRIGVETATGLILPSSALIDGEGEDVPSIAVIRDGKVRRVRAAVALRDSLSDDVVVRADANAGDAVLVGAAKALSEGTAVQVTARADT